MVITCTSSTVRRIAQWVGVISWVLAGFAASFAAELPDTLERIKPSIVAIGTYQKTRSPPFVFRGTGFIVGDGMLVATNAHVVPEMLKAENGEALVIIASPGCAEAQIRTATLRASDKAHDLALLRTSGAALPALTLHDESPVREGQEVAFTGFPVGNQLDATAYPGNSGSPLFDVSTGQVAGIINMVLVRGTRESALSQPSGISFAIPVQFLRQLIEAAG